jgi:hypothetical protein
MFTGLAMFGWSVVLAGVMLALVARRPDVLLSYLEMLERTLEGVGGR